MIKSSIQQQEYVRRNEQSIERWNEYRSFKKNSRKEKKIFYVHSIYMKNSD